MYAAVSAPGSQSLRFVVGLAAACDEAYGVPIAQAIEHSSGRPVSIGSVYVTLDRLAKKGLVCSRLGEPTAERGGRAKTYFRITAAGLRGVQQAQRTLTGLWSGVPKLRGGIA